MITSSIYREGSKDDGFKGMRWNEYEMQRALRDYAK